MSIPQWVSDWLPLASFSIQGLSAILLAVYVILTYGLWKEARRKRAPMLNIQWDMVGDFGTEVADFINQEIHAEWEDRIRKNYEHVKNIDNLPTNYWVATVQNVGGGFITRVQFLVDFQIKDIVRSIFPHKTQGQRECSYWVASGRHRAFRCIKRYFFSYIRFSVKRYKLYRR